MEKKFKIIDTKTGQEVIVDFDRFYEILAITISTHYEINEIQEPYMYVYGCAIHELVKEGSVKIDKYIFEVFPNISCKK